MEYLFPSPMGIFFISMSKTFITVHSDGDIVSVPYGDLFYFYMILRCVYFQIVWKFPSPMGIFFISICLDYTICNQQMLFPSPMGIFFISILSYGNLTGHGENLHFAVQKVFSGKIRGFEACKLLSPLILCPAVQNYDSTSSILPIP